MASSVNLAASKISGDLQIVSEEESQVEIAGRGSQMRRETSTQAETLQSRHTHTIEGGSTGVSQNPANNKDQPKESREVNGKESEALLV